jgi:hypothetical protein
MSSFAYSTFRLPVIVAQVLAFLLSRLWLRRHPSVRVAKMAPQSRRKHNCKHHCQTSVGSNMHVFRVKCKDCNKELFRCNKKLAPSWLNLCQQRMQEMVGDAAVAASPGSKKGAAVAAPDSDDGDSETCYYSDWEVLDGTNPVCTNSKHGKRSNSKDGTRSAEPPTPDGLH